MKITSTAKGITVKNCTYNTENTLLNVLIVGILTIFRINRTIIEKLVGSK